MFFTNDLLVKSHGKFAIVWLAAMGKKLKKKEYESVDIIEVCHDLKDQLVPTWGGNMVTIKGFSLRLSAQLIYGLTLIFDKKMFHLYRDTNMYFQSMYKRAKELYPVTEEDPTTEAQVTDNFNQLDPLFGKVVGVDFVSDFDMSLFSGYDCSLPEVNVNQEERQRNLATDSSKITISENVEEELDQDLLSKVDQVISGVDDLNIYQPVEDQNMFLPEVEETLPISPKKRSSRKKVEKKKEDELIKETEELLQNPELVQDPELFQEPELVHNPDQVEDPEVVQEPGHGQEAETRKNLSASLVLDPVASQSTTRRKKKILKLKIDQEIEVNKDQMKKQIENCDEDELKLMSQYRLPTASELFCRPAQLLHIHQPTNFDFFTKSYEDDVVLKEIPEVIQFAENLKYVEETETAVDVEPAEPQEVAMEEVREFDQTELTTESINVERNISRTSFLKHNQTPIESSISRNDSLEVSRKNTSRSSALRQQSVSFAGTEMQPLIEDQLLADEPLLPPLEAQDEDFMMTYPKESTYFQDLDSKLSCYENEVYFSTLAPQYKTSKIEAVKLFSQLLEKAKFGALKLQQEECWSDFLVIPS